MNLIKTNKFERYLDIDDNLSFNIKRYFTLENDMYNFTEMADELHNIIDDLKVDYMESFIISVLLDKVDDKDLFVTHCQRTFMYDYIVGSMFESDIYMLSYKISLNRLNNYVSTQDKYVKEVFKVYGIERIVKVIGRFNCYTLIERGE